MGQLLGKLWGYRQWSVPSSGNSAHQAPSSPPAIWPYLFAQQGDLEVFPGRGLPYHLEEHILDKLSLGQLARVSRTSHTFQKIFTRRLDKELKARYDVLLEHFGKERIASIATLIEGCLKGEIMRPAFGDPGKSFSSWMSADGKLHVSQVPWCEDVAIRCRGDVTMVTNIPEWDVSPTMLIIKWGRDDRQVWLWISRCVSAITISTFCPRGHKPLQAVALVRRLLSGDYGPAFRSGGQPVKVYIT